MNFIDIKIPKIGESISAVQLISLKKQVGEYVEEDECLAEVASDKIDIEITAESAGYVKEFYFKEGEEIKVGSVLAKLEKIPQKVSSESQEEEKPVSTSNSNIVSENLFLSPLVKRIIREHNLKEEELQNIVGTGFNGRISKVDVFKYLEKQGLKPSAETIPSSFQSDSVSEIETKKLPSVSLSGSHEIIEMDKMRRVIAQRMKSSKQISPHVTAFVEADVTDLVNWRNKNKEDFSNRFKQNLTITPLLILAVVKAIQDFPLINVSVDETETKIIKHHDINIGIATELPNGNLIVPVIKGANHYNLEGLALKLNELVNKARLGKLSPDDVTGGTFTVSNVGVFGNLMGTPIINQPEVAILGTGTIKKKPAVIESDLGDVIAIRQFMFLSLSFDHRVVDGSLGGVFLKRIGDYLERWNLHNQL